MPWNGPPLVGGPTFHRIVPDEEGWRAAPGGAGVLLQKDAMQYPHPWTAAANPSKPMLRIPT